MASPLDALPAAVREALQQGNALEAMRRLRETRGVGLAAARRQIEQLAGGRAAADAASPAQPAAPPARPGAALAPGQTRRDRRDHPGLAPGEVPRSRDALWRWIVVALLAFLLWSVLRG